MMRVTDDDYAEHNPKWAEQDVVLAIDDVIQGAFYLLKVDDDRLEEATAILRLAAVGAQVVAKRAEHSRRSWTRARRWFWAREVRNARLAVAAYVEELYKLSLGEKKPDRLLALGELLEAQRR